MPMWSCQMVYVSCLRWLGRRMCLGLCIALRVIALNKSTGRDALAMGKNNNIGGASRPRRYMRKIWQDSFYDRVVDNQRYFNHLINYPAPGSHSSLMRDFASITIQTKMVWLRSQRIGSGRAIKSILSLKIKPQKV